MFFAFITMNIAGTIEVFRHESCDANSINGTRQLIHLDLKAPLSILAARQSKLSVFWQLPQNIFMGLSEIFAMVASFEYAFFAAPRSAQTLFMSLRFCFLGISSFAAAGYMAAFATKKSSIDGKPFLDFEVSIDLKLFVFFIVFLFKLFSVQ